MIYALFALFSAAFVAADQLTKIYVDKNFYIGQSKTVIDGVLSLTYVQNRGAAFGILPNAGALFIAVTVVVVVAVILYIVKTRPRSVLELSAVSLILSGAVGNAIDRVLFGYVRDFLEVKFFEFPIFNVADCAICTGAVLLIIHAFTQGKGEKDGETDTDCN